METYDKMAISNENFIHSLTLELGFPATEDDIFEKADAIYTNHILPTIDSTLNKFDHTTEDILIDDMEIDLGEIKECDSSNRLDEKLKYILERRIKQGNQVENHNAKSLLQTDKANQVGSTESVLFTYLKDGTIPWYADESNFDLKNQISNHLEKINDDREFNL